MDSINVDNETVGAIDGVKSEKTSVYESPFCAITRIALSEQGINKPYTPPANSLVRENLTA